MTKEEKIHKIDYEIIPDCYDAYEVEMSWFYYFNDNLEFPFEAEIYLKNRKGKKSLVKIDVLAMVKDGGDFNDETGVAFEVSPKKSDFVFDINIRKLKNAKGNSSVKEAFEIWQFWRSDDYE